MNNLSAQSVQLRSAFVAVLVLIVVIRTTRTERAIATLSAHDRLRSSRYIVYLVPSHSFPFRTMSTTRGSYEDLLYEIVKTPDGNHFAIIPPESRHLPSSLHHPPPIPLEHHWYDLALEASREYVYTLSKMPDQQQVPGMSAYRLYLQHVLGRADLTDRVEYSKTEQVTKSNAVW